MTKKKAPFAVKLLLAIFSPVLFCLLLEGGLRLSPWSDELGPQRYHGGLVDHAHFWNPDSMLNLDAEILMPGGEMRGKKVAMAKPEGVFRIVTLGGSFTYGWPFNNQPEVAYPSVLEREINADERVPFKVEVLNGGVGGYSSFQGLFYFKNRLVHFKPDLITICFGANDANGNETIGVHMTDRQYYEHLEDLSKRKNVLKVKKGLDSLRTYALIEKFNYWLGHLWSESTRRVPPEDFRHNLEIFVKLAKEHNFRILLIPEPAIHMENLNLELEVNPYTKAMGEAAKKHPDLIKLVDFITPLAKQDKKATFYDVMHLTVPGNKFAGRLLKESAIKSGFVKLP